MRQSHFASPRGPVSSAKRRLLSGGLWVFTCKAIMVTAAVSSNALLARLLDPGDLGTYFLAFSIVSFVALLGAMGLGQTAVRLVAENIGLDRAARARAAIGKVLKLGLGGSFGVAAIYFLLGEVVALNLFRSTALASLTGLMSFWIIVLALQRILPAVFRGLQNMGLASLFEGTIAGVLIAISLGVIKWTHGRTSLSAVLLIATGSYLFATLIAGLSLRGRMAALPVTAEEKGMGLKEVFSVSSPFLITNVTFFLLGQSSLWIVAFFLSPEDVAVFGAATRIVTLMGMPLLIVNTAVQPQIAEMFFQGRKRELEDVIRSSATFIGGPMVLVLIGLFFLSDPVLGIVFGDYYRQGASLLMVLCAGQMINTWSGSSGVLLNMTGHHGKAMKINCFSALVAFGLSILAVSRFGMIGVASATALGSVTRNIMLVLWGVKLVGIKPYMRWPFAPVMVCDRKGKGPVRGNPYPCK